MRTNQLKRGPQPAAQTGGAVSQPVAVAATDHEYLEMGSWAGLQKAPEPPPEARAWRPTDAAQPAASRRRLGKQQRPSSAGREASRGPAPPPPRCHHQTSGPALIQDNVRDPFHSALTLYSTGGRSQPTAASVCKRRQPRCEAAAHSSRVQQPTRCCRTDSGWVLESTEAVRTAGTAGLADPVWTAQMAPLDIT